MAPTRLRAGPYAGEVSALCLVPSPAAAAAASAPLLLAGTGSQLLLYDLGSGELLSSLLAFHGIRVHGIVLLSSGTEATRVAVFGETTLKLFLLSSSSPSLREHPQEHLPPFDHWVLHASSLRLSTPVSPGLAVGLSDNSLALWDLSARCLIARIPSPHRCLLYSMTLHGHSIPALRVAAGTIYNQVSLHLQPFKANNQCMLASPALIPSYIILSSHSHPAVPDSNLEVAASRPDCGPLGDTPRPSRLHLQTCMVS